MKTVLTCAVGVFLAIFLTSAAGAPGGAADLEKRVEELEDRLNALESVFEVDDAGNATIKPAGHLILDAAGMTEIMDDTMVKGKAMLESDTTMMQDAEIMGDTMVMGDTMLEGDTMMMEDAMIMGDASIQQETKVSGSFVQPFNTATISGGVLVPDSTLSSFLHVTDTESELNFIPAAASVGANLRIQADGRFKVFSCEFEADCVATNILLKPNSRFYRMVDGNVLVLSWDGSVWNEVARSNGIAAVATLQDSFGVGALNEAERIFACDPAASGAVVPQGGIDNSVLLNGVVLDVIDDPDLEAHYELVELDPGAGHPGGGGPPFATVWGLRTVVQNNGVFFRSVDVLIRCLVF
jgi:hypothetical protein